MGTARVVEILIAEAAKLPMKTLTECDAVAGCGLQGDRYFSNSGTFSPNPQKPDFEITLIEKECVEAFARESGVAFTAADARRNIVTEGIQLNDLAGSQFTIGEVLLQGIRLCEPCTHLARISFPEVLQGLVHKGGLRAQIIRGGKLRVGDEIRTITS
ncbi:MAG TPA: MOSC domain-containing protein [Verrucomicrobiae bacterium]|nr:MOSC domain-containing protein [Verrucomicrobiae bacterium]